MLIIYGVYHFWPKRVGFRNDYCLGCDKARRSFAVRTFDVGHIFWIPFLPFGFWKHWKCSECARDPHVHVRTRRPFKWLGFACLIFFSSIFWFPLESNNEAVWIFRMAPLAGATALLIHLLKTPKDPSLTERLAAIPPAADAICPFCSTPLIAGDGSRWSCPACGAVRC
jgi:hypothetical protein